MKVWERWGPLTGVLSVACSLYGTLLVLDQPQDADSDRTIVAYFARQAHRTQGIVGFFVFLAGILFLIVFLASLRERLEAADGGSGRLGALAYGAGIAGAAVWIVAMLVARADTFAASDTAKFRVDPNTYRLLADMAYFGWVAAVAVSALVVWATSAVVLRTSLLPRWFGWLGIVLGVVQLFGIFFFPFFAWWLWLGLTSVLLVARQRPATAPVPQPAL